MNYELKNQIAKAIDNIIEDNCEDGFWEGLIHPKLSTQMTEAAALVFDSCMDGQEYKNKEG